MEHSNKVGFCGGPLDGPKMAKNCRLVNPFRLGGLQRNVIERLTNPSAKEILAQIRVEMKSL